MFGRGGASGRERGLEEIRGCCLCLSACFGDVFSNFFALCQSVAFDYEARAARRGFKNFVKGYTEAEACVRDATSNDPWAAPKPLLLKLSDFTYDHQACREVMDMTYKRMNDSGKVRDAESWQQNPLLLTLLFSCAELPPCYQGAVAFGLFD